MTLARLLLVDDHKMLLDSLARLFRDDPTIGEIRTAETGAEAIEAARTDPPDLVVMDYQLPDMTGADAIRVLRAEHPGLKVIVLTGSDRRGAYLEAVEAGCSAWVRKTRGVDELVAAVHDVNAGLDLLDRELERLPPDGQLVLHYQPVVDLATREIVGFEALVRWDDPERGLRPPAEFIPAAEETGVITRLSQWVAREAATQLATWQREFPSSPRRWMSINVSASSLVRREFADEVRALLDASGLDPGDVVLEVTETVVLEDTDETATHLADLKAHGMRLALDDFGTAFSSLSYLRRFPFDHIKIDRSFTAELPASDRTRLLVEAIGQLAAAIGLTGIAEGIEQLEQADLLLAAGWRLGQGYLFARPADAATIETLLRRASL